MSTLTITAKGQVTLRKDLLRHLGVGPGDRVSVQLLPNGHLDVRAASPTGKISDAFGLLHRPDGPSFTIEEINEAIAKGWAGER
ncbi:MAG: AbrB/MazE/SpoVT family DNA-binding domain-containing protein [Caulobacterales bacterium]|nr:AbrB/MazE/SpoVT family DNA-binding domain-containing protein [Caulobacterales bacterium]